VLSARDLLERALQRFAEAAVCGDDAAALEAFADAQGLMPVLRSCRDEAACWLAVELEAAGFVGEDVEFMSPTRQRAAWDAARRQVAPQ
jgi:hypothetical protein